jgi:hypothetical protein
LIEFLKIRNLHKMMDGSMLTFGTTDLQRRTADVQKAALKSPVMLTYHDKPRFIMMTVEEYARRLGVSLVAGHKALPDSAVVRLQAMVERHPDAECVVAGGLAALGDEETELGGRAP